MKSLQKAAGLAIVAVVMLLTLNLPVFSQSSEITFKTDFEEVAKKRNYSEASSASHWTPQNDHFSNEVSQAVENAKFMKVYREALKLNITRFKDVNDIQIGDTVLFPARTVGGTPEYWVADQPQNQLGKNDCIWRLTERYLENTLPTKPAVIIMPPAPVATVVDPKEYDSSIWWILILFGLAIVALYYYFRNTSTDYKKRQRNPDTHPPVMTEALSYDPEQAAYQIAQEYDVPFNHIVSAERIVFLRDSGVATWTVQMQFNDTQREVDVLPGETYTLIVTDEENGEQLQSLFRNHCGNRTGTIVSNGEIRTERNEAGEIILPKGWRIVKEAEYVRPVQSADAKINSVPKTAKNQETAASALNEEYASMAPVIDNNFVPAIIRSMPKNADNIDFQITATEINISVKLK